jgi:hypothetical protein
VVAVRGGVVRAARVAAVALAPAVVVAAVTAARVEEMVAAMVEAIEWVKVGWVKDEADRARAEEMVAAVVESLQRVCCSGAEPICSFCEGARAAHMRTALANSREVLGDESFEHDREGHRGEKLLEVAGEWRRRARPKSVALSGTWT